MKTILCALCSSLALAQVGGPVLGLVPDGAAVRVMVGMPGAGAVGPVVASGLSAIAISPAQNFAIGMDANGAAQLALASGAMSPVAGVAANANQIAISPTGSAAALWFAANSQFQIVTGLPGAASVRATDASAFGAPIAFAVSDDGHLAASFAAGVEMFSPDGSVAPVAVSDRVTALAFYANSASLAMASAASVFSLVNGTLTALYRAAPQPGRELRAAGAPGGIAVSQDGLWMAAAMHDGSVISIHLTSGAASKTVCGCLPDGVFTIGGAAFRLTNAVGSAGVKLIDASSGNILDVPPAAGGAR